MKKVLFAGTSCVILSAGSSARMGTHKALLKFDSQKTFIQKITDTYLQSGIDHVIVVANSELFKLINNSSLTLSEKLLLVINDRPELGRFYSLQTGMKHVNHGNSCFFQNIDNPFTSETLLRELIIHKNEADVILPAFQDRAGHPVLISSTVVQQINSGIDYEVRIDAFLKQYSEKRIGISDQRILININSQEEYLNAGFGV
jgi:CTP:molybdopterin cytidylyltransferase MocA